MKINVICGNQSNRMPILMNELKVQGISDYELWDGVYLHDSAKRNINAAHKRVVEYASVAGYPFTIIAEDDLRFTHPTSWRKYIDGMPEDSDIHLSGCYLPEYNYNGTIKSFCGLHLYRVRRDFYETFLNLPPDEHIDRALSGIGIITLADPMLAIQWNGFSSNTGKDEVYDALLKDRNLFGM